jgi:hypothetical protein
MSTPRFPDIGQDAATSLELALEALRDRNLPRAVGCLAAIDGKAWEAITIRFPNLSADLATYRFGQEAGS